MLWPGLALVAACACLAAVEKRAASGGLRRNSGESVLDVLFGEGRRTVSLTLFDRADLYFHGGVSEAAQTCADSAISTRGGAVSSRREADLTGHALGAGEHAEAAEPAASGNARFPDPWQWLNDRLHPRSHRHVGGNESKEIVPWLWASVRLDPHNLLAWQVTAYWLARQVGKPEEGIRLIQEAIRLNPDSAELEFCRGELLAVLKRQDESAAAFRLALGKWKPEVAGEDPEDLKFLKTRILVYLGDYAERAGRTQEALGCFQDALRVTPGQVHATERVKALAGSGAPASR